MPGLVRREVEPLIRLALREDAAFHDRTSRALLLPSVRIRARIVAHARGLFAGGPVAVWTFHAMDPSLRCRLTRREGAVVRPGDMVLAVEGCAQSIFAAERTALNLLGHLCGIATLTNAFVRRVKPFHAKILDTRKTLPGLRALEKYAVRIGGGDNHRASLQDAILIKTNHLAALKQETRGRRHVIQHAVETSRKTHPVLFIEVEVANLNELREALTTRADAILLDNMSANHIRQAVRLRRDLSPLLEVSGGVTLTNVRTIARTGVDRISIGRLTHSAPALDISLEVL